MRDGGVEALSLAEVGKAPPEQRKEKAALVSFSTPTWAPSARNFKFAHAKRFLGQETRGTCERIFDLTFEKPLADGEPTQGCGFWK